MEVAAVPAEMVTGPVAIREYPLSQRFSFFFSTVDYSTIVRPVCPVARLPPFLRACQMLQLSLQEIFFLLIFSSMITFIIVFCSHLENVGWHCKAQ